MWTKLPKKNLWYAILFKEAHGETQAEIWADGCALVRIGEPAPEAEIDTILSYLKSETRFKKFDVLWADLQRLQSGHVTPEVEYPEVRFELACGSQTIRVPYSAAQQVIIDLQNPTA